MLYFFYFFLIINCVAEVYVDSDSGEDFYGFSDEAGDSTTSY